MQAVNKKMDPQKTLQTMQNFQKENMKMEMTEEMSRLKFSIFFFTKQYSNFFFFWSIGQEYNSHVIWYWNYLKFIRE